MPNHHINILNDKTDLVHEAHKLVTQIARETIAERGVFHVALSGGSTPRPLYESLADDNGIDWADWRIFFSDERCVPPDDEESNYRMVKEALLDRLDDANSHGQPGSVARVQGELEPAEAAADYEEAVRMLVGQIVPEPSPGDGIRDDTPRFDLILLGLGDDGHTASLFPGTQALHERERLVVANWVPKFDAHRLTFTYRLINAAHNVIFLVSGTGKNSALKDVLEGERDIERLPAQGVAQAAGHLTWLVDRAAASVLSV